MNANGVVLLDKPKGITSQTAVNIVKHIYGVKKAGHCGTLDPDASGILPVMIGNGVKLSEYLTDHNKEYIASIKLGIKTDTGDIGGNIIEKCEYIPDFEGVKAAAESFIGGYDQIPPMYSALKVNGTKLVNAARKGIEIERTPRHIEISAVECYGKDGDIFLRVACSRGTYIRTLCEDIGKKAGSLGTMSSLRRTKVGNFSVENAVTPEEMREMSGEALEKLVIPVEKILENLPEIKLCPFHEKLIVNGCSVEAEKITKSFPSPGTECRLYGQNGFFALGEVCENEGIIYIKHKKMFV